MKKRWFTWIFIAGLAVVLSGCQLAKQELGEEADVSGDRLIGMYITQEYLDLFDFEKYFNDHMGQLMSGKETVVEEAARREYGERIYAVYQETKEGAGDYIFEGMDGVSFFYAKMPHPQDAGLVLQAGPEVTDIKISESDTGQEIEGTIYCTTGGKNGFYFNPVYQTAKGEVYLLAGTGISGNLTDGAAFSQRMDEKRTTDKNGEESSENYAVSITICGRDACDRYVIAQMDEQDQKLQETVYLAKELPDCVEVLADAAYLLCTSCRTESDGTEKLSRQVVELSWEENDFSLFVPKESGLLQQKWIVAKRRA